MSSTDYYVDTIHIPVEGREYAMHPPLSPIHVHAHRGEAYLTVCVDGRMPRSAPRKFAIAHDTATAPDGVYLGTAITEIGGGMLWPLHVFDVTEIDR